MDLPLLKRERGPRARARLKREAVASLLRESEPSSRRLAAKLERCAPNSRCGSEACIDCASAKTRWFREQSRIVFGDAEVVTYTTIQIPRAACLAKSLATLDPSEQRRLLNDAILAAGLSNAPFFGAADISLNFYAADLGSFRWSWHWSLFSQDSDCKAITKAFSRVLKRTPLVRKPVLTLPVTYTPDNLFGYGLKSEFKTRPIAESGGRYRDEDPIDPRHPAFNDLAVFLDRLHPFDRIFAQNLPTTFIVEQH
jgi:hypothetical protein